MTRIEAVYPIAGEDIAALPVKDLAGAISFYEAVLGFSTVSRDSSAAVVARDGVRLGLVQRAEHEPGKAGSLAFEVSELEEVHRELQSRGGKPGEFGTDEWDGKLHRTFFLREDTNGYCYCFFS